MTALIGKFSLFPYLRTVTTNVLLTLNFSMSYYVFCTDRIVTVSLSYRAFSSLPKNNKHCSSVDTKTGLWYFCATCTKQVQCRKGRAFTVARWNDHELSPSHRENVRRLNEVHRLELKQKAKSAKLTSLEKHALKQLTKSQSPLQQFFQMKLSKKAKEQLATLPVMTVPTAADSTDTVNEDVVEVYSIVSPLTRGVCEGVLPDFRGQLKNALRVYSIYASIDVNSSYKLGYVGGRHEKKAQVFSKVCVGGKGVYRKHTNGRIFSCESCEAFR